MNKCITTKLKGVADGIFPYADSVRFNVPAGFEGHFNSGTSYDDGDIVTFKYVVEDNANDIGFYVDKGTSYKGKEVSDKGDYRYLKASSTKDGYVLVSSKNSITNIRESLENNKYIKYHGKFLFLKELTQLTNLYFRGAFSTTEYLSDLSTLTNLVTLSLNITSSTVVGTLDDIKSLIHLTTLNITWTGNTITGDLNALFDYWALNGKGGTEGEILKLMLDGSRLTYNDTVITSNKSLSIRFQNGSWEDITT